MTYDWLLWLYGLTFIAAICNTPTWWWLTYRALHDTLPVRYVLARMAVALFNVGVLFVVWVRASEIASLGDGKIKPIPLIIGVTEHLEYVFWGNHPGMFRAIGTGFLLAGEALMLITSAISIHMAGKRALNWRVFIGLAIFWTIIHWATAL